MPIENLRAALESSALSHCQGAPPMTAETPAPEKAHLWAAYIGKRVQQSRGGFLDVSFAMKGMIDTALFAYSGNYEPTPEGLRDWLRSEGVAFTREEIRLGLECAIKFEPYPNNVINVVRTLPISWALAAAKHFTVAEAPKLISLLETLRLADDENFESVLLNKLGQLKGLSEDEMEKIAKAKSNPERGRAKAESRVINGFVTISQTRAGEIIHHTTGAYYVVGGPFDVEQMAAIRQQAATIAAAYGLETAQEIFMKAYELAAQMGKGKKAA